MRLRTLNSSLAVLFICVSGGVLSSQAAAVEHVHPVMAQKHSAYIHKVASESGEGAKNFISGVAKRGIDFLSNEKLSSEQRKREFQSLLKSSFDIKTIARFALGRYWRVASPAEQQEYLKLFEKMIVEVYSQRFDEYQGQAVNVLGVREEGNKDFLVNTEIVPDNGPKFDVAWRVRFRNGQYKIIDVIVEGVSMALNQRSDFSSVIQRGGGKVDVLLVHLRN